MPACRLISGYEVIGWRRARPLLDAPKDFDDHQRYAEQVQTVCNRCQVATGLAHVMFGLDIGKDSRHHEGNVSDRMTLPMRVTALRMTFSSIEEVIAQRRDFVYRACITAWQICSFVTCWRLAIRCDYATRLIGNGKRAT